MNNKKIVLEIIIIPLCIFYMIFMFLKSGTASSIIFMVSACITAIWLAPKCLNEVYIYKNKYNILKLIFGISTILLGIISVVNLFVDAKVITILLLIFSIMVFIGLIYFFVKNIKVVMTSKKEFGINILYSFFSFLFFMIMLSTLIIYLR